MVGCGSGLVSVFPIWLLMQRHEVIQAILLPVAVLSMLRVTSGTDAGRIATRPNMALFAKPIDAARLRVTNRGVDFDAAKSDGPIDALRATALAVWAAGKYLSKPVLQIW